MTPFATVRRAVPAALLGAALAFGAAACGGDSGTDTASAESPAPDLGQSMDRVRLTEGASYTMEASSGAMADVRLTGHENGEEPAVSINVAPEDGESSEHSLRLGDELDVEGDRWRVSEIGMSDAASEPSSVTLTRGEESEDSSR